MKGVIWQFVLKKKNRFKIGMLYMVNLLLAFIKLNKNNPKFVYDYLLVFYLLKIEIPISPAGVPISVVSMRKGS